MVVKCRISHVSNGLVMVVFKVLYMMLLHQLLTTFPTCRGAKVPYFKKECLYQRKRKPFFLPYFQSLFQVYKVIDLSDVDEGLVIFIMLNEQVTNDMLHSSTY